MSWIRRRSESRECRRHGNDSSLTEQSKWLGVGQNGQARPLSPEFDVCCLSTTTQGGQIDLATSRVVSDHESMPAPVATDVIATDWHERGFSGGLWVDPPGQVWADFVHDTDELVMVVEGEVEFEIGDALHRPEPGEELLIPAGTNHRVADPPRHAGPRDPPPRRAGGVFEGAEGVLLIHRGRAGTTNRTRSQRRISERFGVTRE